MSTLVSLICGHLIAAVCNEDIFLNKLHSYTWANYETFCGRNVNAETWYKTFFSLSNDHNGYKGYIYFLYQKNDFDSIIYLQDTIKKHFSTDAHIQKTLAFAFKKNGKNQDGDALFIALAQQFPDNQEILFHAISSHIRAQQYEQALTLLDVCVNKSESHLALFHFLKAQIYLTMGKKNEARAALEVCLQINSHFDKGWLLLGLLAEQEGKFVEALGHFMTYLQKARNPEPHIKNHIHKLLQKQKKLLHNYSWLLLGNHQLHTSTLYVQSLLEYNFHNIFQPLLTIL